MQLSIIIVNYNVKYFLEQCLASVEKAIEKLNAEVFVIDNASTDGSIDYLQQRFCKVKFIANKTNAGFAKANNIALQQCKGDYVLFLNPDTILPENILDNCISFFNSNKNVAAVGVQMIDGSGKFLPESKRSFPSALVSFYKLSGLSALFPKSKIFNRYALEYLDKDSMHEVDVLCGAFMMVDRTVLLQLQGFDEAFFMYAEDIDLCYRLKQTGKKIFYLGNETIVHFKGESSLQKKRQHVLVFYKAMIIFVRKHYKGTPALVLKSLLYAGIFLRGMASMIVVPFRSLFNKASGAIEMTNRKKYVTGDNNSVHEAVEILKQNKISNFEQNSKPELLQQSDIMFCTGDFSYAAGIGYMKNNKGNNRFGWHGLHTKSIVGSSDKRSSGDVYHL